MRNTCAGCQNLVRIDMIHNQLFSCGPRGCPVPHQSDGDKVTFWRVPMECPLADTEVKKTTKLQPKKNWVIMSMKEAFEKVPEIKNPTGSRGVV